MDFQQEVTDRITSNGVDACLQEAASEFMLASVRAKYSYNFSWLGRPIIQYPQDIVAMQEIIWRVKPDLIIETGIAHGGSLVFSASMLELNASCGGPHDAMVVGIDIDIRAHNRKAIETHPFFKRMSLIEGSSIAPGIVEQVNAMAHDRRCVLVCLDSNHTHDHVLAELQAYAPLSSVGSYCVVFDTIVEDMSKEYSPDRPWGPGNSPKSAVKEFLRDHPEFEIDDRIDHQLLVSVNPSGYLRRVR
jgi:cephalosporin hydroxylase